MADSEQPATATGRDAVLSDLMRRITLRDQSALTALYDATSSQVYGLALSILRCEADAEEVTLDVFERLWRTASIRFDPAKGSVLALILVMTRNLSIDRRRAKLARSA
ncbi:MAG: hypothetical protein H7039_24685 [Bryobacteraceae bacterium]|nr:hypothetical protein [Bryobacteraceae bacterium]